MTNSAAERAALAFYQHRHVGEKRISASVKVSMDVRGLTSLYLHGHLIAQHNRATNTVRLLDAGWQTATTKRYLNAVLSLLLKRYSIRQIKGQWFVVYTAGENMVVKHKWTGSDTWAIDPVTDTYIIAA